MPPVARWLRESVYKPISAYGVIGDTRTAALVGADGSIDWCCFPRFDSASVFAAILDIEKGGSFSIQPAGEFTSQQRYFPLTNILLTGFHLHDGTGAFGCARLHAGAGRARNRGAARDPSQDPRRARARRRQHRVRAALRLCARRDAARADR
jgi:hypothetical protein